MVNPKEANFFIKVPNCLIFGLGYHYAHIRTLSKGTFFPLLKISSVEKKSPSSVKFTSIDILLTKINLSKKRAKNSKRRKV